MADLKPFTGELDAPTSLKPFDGQLDGEKAKPASAMRKLGDLGLGFASGAVGATKALADVAGAGNKASRVLGDINTGINDYLSPAAKADQQEQGRLMADAKAKGFNLDGIAAGAKAFAVAPGQAIAQGMGSVVPIIAGTAMTGGVAPAAAVGAGIGVAMGAGTAKGSIFEEVKKRGIAKGLTEDQATAEADKAQEYGGANTDQIALGGALGAADALTGVSAAASRMARGALRKPVADAAANAAERGVLARAGMGMLGEMPLEAAQGGQEQVAANLAAQRAGYEAGTWDNVASNATLEALASAGPGAAFGALDTQTKQPQPPVVPPAPVQESGIDPATGTTDESGTAPANGMSYNPDAGQMTQFPDGSQSFTSEVPPVEPTKPSEAMGLNPAAGPMSAAAVTAVDGGVTQGIQLADAAAADQAAYEQATQAEAEQAAKVDSIDKPITSGPIAEAAMSDEDKRAILFSNKAVADGGVQYEGTKDGDILNGMGKPYPTRFAAQRRARMEGKDWTIAAVFDGYVARRKDANVEPSSPAGLAQGSNEPKSNQPRGSGVAALAEPIDGRRGNVQGDARLAAGNGPAESVPLPSAGPAAVEKPQNQSQDLEPSAQAATESVATAAPEIGTSANFTPAGVSAVGSVVVEGEGVVGAKRILAAAKQEQAKADLDHLFGLDQKRPKAIERIAKGTAYFSKPLKAQEFIAKNGLKDTHKSVKTSATRWDIVAKDSQPQGNTNGTQATQAIEATQEGQEAPAVAKPVTERQARIESTLSSGGKVVGSTLRTSNGMTLMALTETELAAIPDTKKDTSEAIAARADAVYGKKPVTPQLPPAAPVSTSPAVQDFIDGKRNDAPTIEEVKAETEPYFAEAKALLAAQKKATGNPTEEAKVRKQLRDLAGKVQDGSKASSALDIAATRLGMGEGKLKGLEFAESAKTPEAPSPLLQKAIDKTKTRVASTAKTPSADELRAKADLMNALADLGSIFNAPFKANMLPEQEQKLLPVLTRVLDAAFRLGYTKFKDAAKFALDQIGIHLGGEMADALTLDHLQGAYIAMAGGKSGSDTKRAVIDIESKSEIQSHTAQTELEKTAEPDQKAGSLTDKLSAEILGNNMPKDNPALKKLVEAFDGKPADQNRMKEAQEALEAAIVNVSRDIVAKKEGTRTTFDVLLRLYQSQPNLNIRTSTSIANQAYSTPAPLAYLGSVLADVTPKTSMYEPTGGNGMLTINALPANVTVNELEPGRIAALKEQGFAKVLEGDALKAHVAPKSQDRVMTNPPFGSVKNDKGEPVKVSLDGYKIGQIDHLIAARALETLKDDGKATLIIGANKVAGGLNTDDRIFFNWLYRNYNVTSHFELDGDLYNRQGAGWPVRVITINGRQKSDRVSPVAGTIQRAQNWEQVYEHFTASLGSSRTGSQQKPGASTGGTGAVQAGLQPIRESAGTPNATTGGLGQEGSSVSPGNVAGASAGNGTDSPERVSGQLGDANSEQRLHAESVASNRLDPAGDGIVTAPAKPAGNPGATALSSAENQFQVTYEPRSSRKDGGVLIPVNMKDPTQDALSRLEDAVGNIDDYLTKQLGYNSVQKLHEALMGLQVDSVASAIYQIEQGKGVVIADQTGIGKGRQAAAVIRWAERSGYIPVFVSVKPSLFTDMFGDLHDIGSDNITPFILNKDESIKGPAGEKLFANKAATHKRTIESIRDNGALPQGSNAIFMTYSQVNTDNVQRQMLTTLTDRAVFILDESHNAGGQSSTGEFITSLLEGAKGVTYLSATYAKRPDNMPLYFKTDIGQAAADNEGLMQAMGNGGLPLQTVVSNNLVKAGQMFRRERSYDGVSIETISDTDHRAEHEKLSDETTKALRAIVAADRMFHHVFVKQMNEEMQQAGGAVIDNAGNQAQAGVDHTQFSSVVHNFVKQMLLGLKAQRAANEAIAALKRNEKPIIAVENTMGSFLEAYAKDNMVLQGGSLGSFDYRTVLSRALARTLFVNEVKPNGDKVKREIKLSQLDVETRASYDAAQAVINSLKLDIPVSPIDWMRNEIRKAGFTVAEITGRKLAVDYSSPGKATLGSIDSLEQSDKVRTTQMFNSGRTDALILNVAGSTGISLHASEKFEDKRQRHMIIGQAAGDINIFMQMLGRIHRTGQVVLPKYTILSVDLPTEKRPTAVLSGKMKSLNANTSSNTDSATSIKTVDMFNKYGDQVVAQYLQDNYVLARDLGVEDLIGGSDAVEDLAQKATGRLALQPIAVQNAFYDEVEGQYSAMMDYLNKTNQNDLEPRTFDYDARETRQEVLFEGANKDSPFGEDAIYGEYSIKAQGKAMTPVEIKEAMLSNLDGKAVAVHMQGTLSPLVKQFDDYIATLEGPARDSANATRATGQAFMVNHSIGDTFRVDINGDSFNAVVTNIRNTHKANGNPFSLSKIQVTIALNGALRSISVPASQFQKIEVSQIGRGYSIEQLFKEQPANQRETAKIVTGNLLAAYGEIQGARGTIITFTKQDGTTEQGILLPKAFDYKNNTRGDYRLATGADALKFLQNSENRDIGRFGIQSRDGVVRVLPSGRGISLLVPKSKLKGGKYFLDRGLIDVLGDFVTSGSAMKATTYDSSDAVKALDLLMKKNALYAIPSMAEEAKSLASDASQDGAVFSASNSAPETQLPLAQIERLVKSALRGVRNPPVIRIVATPEAIGLRAPVNTIPSGVVLANGDIYVFQSGIGSALEVDMVVFHELFHKGLQNVLPKADYVAAMQEIAKTDSKVREYSSKWSSTNAGKAQMTELAKKYSGKELADQYEALAIEEGLAMIAEDLKAKRQMGTKDMRVRGLVSWLAKIADKLGMTRLADKLRAMSYTAAEKFVVDTISKSGGRGPGGGNKFSSKDAKQTDTAAFKAWFGDSKVVDADGKPLVMYHGTPADFHIFNPGLIFLSPDPAFGGEEAIPDDINVLKLYVKAENPFDFENSNHVSRVAAKAAENSTADASQIAEAMTGPEGWMQIERPEVQAAIKALGFDGFYVEENGVKNLAVFNNTQVKSASGNNGDFDGANPDIRFRSLDSTLSSAANSVRDVKLPAGYLVSDLINGAPGKLGWWHKTVGTQYNLAQRSKPFKRVYDAVQTFMNDVSHFATEAADLAPNILPKLETWRDIGKSPLSAADTKALSAPVFEGTLNWARDESGRAVKMDVLEAAAAKLTVEQKAQRLLRGNHLSQQVLKMWQGMKVEQYESMVNAKYERDMLKAGIVFTNAELKQHFNLTDPQIALYREFRAATDKSLSSLAIADMLRFGGDDVAPIRDTVQGAKTVNEAAETLRDYLLSLAEADPERNDVLTDTANRMIEKGDKAQGLIERGYAPLSRFGHYTLDVVDENGERVYFSLFESKMEAAKMRRKMEGLYPNAQITQGTVSEEAYKMFAGVSPETLELFGDMLGLEAQGDSASAQAFQEYLKLAKSNRSAMKRLIQRQGIAGFSEDAGRVLAGFVYSNARQAASSLHMGEMTQAANEIPKTQGELKDAAVKLVDYIKNPQEEAQALRGLLFAQYIGGSVASAMVNMTQPLTMTFPWLSQYGGVTKAAKQMTAAVVDSNKRKTGDARLDAALLKAEEDGTVSPQEVHQLMQQSMGKATLRSGDGTRAGNAMATAQNGLSRVSLAWGKLFGAAEQFNRRVTFIAAYRTAVAEKIGDPEAFARKAIMETQGVYNKGNKPQWARGAIGATLFTFKQYSISYVEMLTRMAKNGPEGKKAALLALGVLFLTAGAGGLPGADDLDDIISGAMQAMGYNFDSKQKRQEFFVSLFGEGGAQFMERGISGLPGVPVDLSGRMGLGNLIPATGLFTKKPDHSRDLAEIAGPAGDLIKRAYDATGKLLTGDIGGKNGAIATIAPKAAQNWYQAFDMANMGMYRDAKGMKVLDTDASDAMVKALGFQPTDVALRQDASFDVQRMIGVNRMRETEIANAWALGIFEKDSEKVQAARENLREWNETNPESPIRINFRQIQQRVKNMNQTKAERIARTAPKEIRADVRRELDLQ